MLLAQTANALISRFVLVRLFVTRLAFNPVELFEELQRLLRRAAAFFLALSASTKRRLEWAMHPRWVAPSSVR